MIPERKPCAANAPLTPKTVPTKIDANKYLITAFGLAMLKNPSFF